VWASGSRTGFGAAVIVSGFVAVALWKDRGVRIRPAAIVAAVAAVMVAVALVSAANVVGPLQRIRQMVPRLDAASLRTFGSEMWNRNGYGAIGTAMIQDFPAFGIGVGGFNTMQADFGIDSRWRNSDWPAVSGGSGAWCCSESWCSVVRMAMR
jgi:O-antigen ligase